MTTVKHNKGKLTRRQLEDRLGQRANAISDRLTAIESDLPVKPDTLRKLARRKQAAKVSLAVIAGIGGLLALKKMFRPRNDEYREGVNRVSGAIAREISKGLRKGSSAEDAVRRAMSKRPPVVRLGGGESNGFWSTLLNQTTKQLISALAPEVIEQLKSYLGTGRRGSAPADSEKN